MGAKHVICILFQGRFVVAQYWQLDGYPEGHGHRLLLSISALDSVDKCAAALLLQTDIDAPGIPKDPYPGSEDSPAPSSQRCRKACDYPITFGVVASTDVLDDLIRVTSEKLLAVTT
ncbi:hypothetical protein LTR95_002778 [Oleoguttula sp. CCFEE 5521]